MTLSTHPLYFDSASTTKCCDIATDTLHRLTTEAFGNPSSAHSLGDQADRVIREARRYFAQVFHVDPEQVIFTGSGSEANNLAIYGIMMAAYLKKITLKNTNNTNLQLQMISSSIEHSSIRKSVESLQAFGIVPSFLPLTSQNQDYSIDPEHLCKSLTNETRLLTIQQVNNILGIQFSVEALAQRAKKHLPSLIVHSDAVQAFGKVPLPRHPTSIDLLSLSAHKVQGPKGVGALIVFNKKLLQNGRLRPLIWGGGQEQGLRSGTQNAALIASFHHAARYTLEHREAASIHCEILRKHFYERLASLGLLNQAIYWNSPPHAVPHIINISAPGVASAPLTKLLEERGCLVSVGSACNSKKTEPDPILQTAGFPLEIQTSSVRISFNQQIGLKDVDHLVWALKDSIRLAYQLVGKKR